jgi:hypothetical protein
VDFDLYAIMGDMLTMAASWRTSQQVRPWSMRADDMAESPGDFTFITTCKGRLEHLKQSLPRMCAQIGAKVIVVDYACPDGTADWVKANFPLVTAMRETTDGAFILSRARNIGAAAASTPWIMFLDADMLVAENFLDKILSGLNRDHYYRATPQSRQNWGSVICTREKYLQAGGYDEVYRGWGTEDDDFYDALEWHGATRADFPAELVLEVAHDDALRTRFHGMSMVTSHRINQCYRKVKYDLMGILRTQLPQSERQGLYEQLRTAVIALEGGARQSVMLKFSLPVLALGLPPGMTAATASVTRMEQALHYSISLMGLQPPRSDQSD